MRALELFIGAVDRLNEWIGRGTAWLTLGCVVVCFAVVVLRYVVGIGFTWLQELYVWQHAMVFMIGAGYTFLHGGHVRVDIFYSRLRPRQQAWINIFGTLFLLAPWLIVLTWSSLPFIQSSWHIREPSSQAGGLPAIYLLKSVIWVFCFVVGVQGLALLARSWLFLAGRPEYSPQAGKH